MALSWAAFSGRVLAVVSDSPMRTWATVQTAEGTSVRLRGIEHPWGEPGIKPGLQTKVNDDTLLGVMPMWLWTLSSIAKGEGVPFCQTCVFARRRGFQPLAPAGCYTLRQLEQQQRVCRSKYQRGSPADQAIPRVYQPWILQLRCKGLTWECQVRRSSLGFRLACGFQK